MDGAMDEGLPAATAAAAAPYGDWFYAREPVSLMCAYEKARRTSDELLAIGRIAGPFASAACTPVGEPPRAGDADGGRRLVVEDTFELVP